MPARKTAAKKATRSTSRAAAPAAGAPAGKSGKDHLADARNDKLSPKRRIAALMSLDQAACTGQTNFRSLLALALDTTAGAEVRGAVLDLLQSATFLPSSFAPRRAEYLEGLRRLRADADSEIRRRALSALAQMQDGDTQALLIQGLDDAAQALLPPEEALQLLSFDPHAGAFDAARRIADKPPSDAARRAALRVLTADGASTDMFERLVRNKSEPSRVRQQAAVALNQLAPDRLRQAARDLTLDESEDDAMRSVGLTTLSVLSDAETLGNDEALEKSVSTMTDKPGSKLLGEAKANYTRRRGL